MIPISNELFYNILKNICPENKLHHFSLFKSSFFSLPKIYKREIVFNIFLDSELKNTIENIYVKAKKIYNILNNFVYNYKLKKAIVYDYNRDLFGNPLSKFDSSQIIDIFQNKTIYKFRITDLINIINESLINCDGLFPAPKKPKNPYTNIYFDNHHLYNLYYKINSSDLIMPILFNLFYDSNFSIKKFGYLNYPYLKERVIEDFPNNNSKRKLIYEIKNMLSELKFKTGFYYIQTPMNPSQKDDFINIFSSSLIKWFKSLYSPNPNIKEHSKDTLISDLKTKFEKNKFPCLKKRILRGRRRRDMSNNIILTNPIPPPPPPPSIQTNTVNIDLEPILNVTRPVNLPPPLPQNRENIVNVYRSNVISLPPLLRPLINENDTSMLLEILNESGIEQDIFRTSDRIPRSPISNSPRNEIISNNTNTTNNTNNTTRDRVSSLFPRNTYNYRR
tara:strand:- start:584 stop:1927 length:1344 start_codon:yes stop_codon:yes gene_type:complete